MTLRTKSPVRLPGQCGRAGSAEGVWGATRAALASAAFFAVMAALGCGAVVDVSNQGIERPGDEAAMVSKARALRLQDEIQVLQRQREDVEHRKADLLKEAGEYLAKSAGVWSDPAVSERERPVQARQYSALAAERSDAAHRYEEVSQAYATCIATRETQREEALRQADKYESMVVPKPSSD